MKHILIGAAFVLAASAAFAGKPATQATKDAQAQVLTSLPFDNTEDFRLAKRGLIARPDPLIIKNDNAPAHWKGIRHAPIRSDGHAKGDPVITRATCLIG